MTFLLDTGNNKGKLKMKIFRNFFLTLLSVIIFVSSAGAEYIFMKDGSIASGKIESETTAAITFRTNDGKVLSIDPKKVLRIIYAELYMGKLYVQKVDGTVFEAYMVDEDRSTYTFRKNLYSPVEMVVRRDDVLFAARKNPRELEGRVEPDRIILKWKPPYSSIKEYNIYVRSSGAYSLAGKSGSPKFTVKGVRSNTIYAVKVTAIDNDGYESIPTNEISIRTMKVKPEPPKNLKCELIPDKSGKSYTAVLKWDAANFVDGRISGYRVIEKKGRTYKDVGFAPQNRFEIKNIDEGKRPSFVIKAVETKDWESENSRIASTLRGYDLSVHPSFIVPFGKFKSLHKDGFGCLMSFMKEHLFSDNFNVGIGLGYNAFNGKTTDVLSSDMMQIFGIVSYRIELFGPISIIPRIAFGSSYNRISYISKGESVKWSGFEPQLLAGFFFEWNIDNLWHIDLGGDYGVVFERSSQMNFLDFFCGVGRRF